jgi:ApeA N-terminal domain 1
MESFDDEGAFWLPGKDGNQIAGRLTFDPADGATLKLMGGFGDLMQQLNPAPRLPRLHGVAGRRFLTLDGCMLSDSTTEMPGGVRNTYYVHRIITDVLFEEDEPLTFDKCSVAFDQLPHWIRRSGVKVGFETEGPEPTSKFVGAKIEFRPLPDETAEIDVDEELRLTATWRLGGNRVTETYLKEDTYLQLKYPAARPLADILNDIKYLQDLLTLATAAPTAATEIKLWRQDIIYESQSGQRPQAMKYYAGQISEQVRLSEPQSEAHILFRFADIGGLPTIARWIKSSRQYQTVVGALLSIRYAPHIFTENRFNNVISAAESFHRLDPGFSNEVRPEEEFERFCNTLIAAVPEEHHGWLRDQIQYANEPRLRRRLIEMAEYAGESFTALYARPKQWASVVTESRNRLTHHDKKRALKFEAGDLYFLAESVFTLVMLCLLRKCEADDKALAAIGESQPTIFLHGKLAEIVPRLNEQIKKLQAQSRAEASHAKAAQSKADHELDV